MPARKSVVKAPRKAYVKRPTLRGKGDYTYDKPGPYGKMGRRIGSAIGNEFAGTPGAWLGNKIGGLAHYAGKLINGHGDYKIGEAPAVNSLFTAAGSRDLPRDPTVSFGNKSVRITHKEYLNDIITSSTAGNFSSINYQLNPGLPQTFPWLSQVANAYNNYKWHGCVVEFKTTSADALNSTNTALGSVMIAADYNSTTFNTAFVNKQEMLNYMGAVDCKPSDCCLMGIECDPKRMPISELYVRSANPPPNQDLRLYDMCSFSIATTGFQATNVNVGEAFIMYDIEFFNPVQLPPDSTALYAEYKLDLPTIGNQVANNATVGLLGAVGSQTMVQDNIGLVFGNSVSGASSAIFVQNFNQIQNGTHFIIEYCVQGVSTALLGAPVQTQPGGTLTGTGIAGSSGIINLASPNVASTSTTSSLVWHVVVPDASKLTRTLSANYLYPTGVSSAYAFAAFNNTAVATATQTVPTPSTYASLKVWQINPAQLNGVTTLV